MPRPLLLLSLFCEAVLSVIQHKYQSRKFDQGDTTVLRALMRRYGWERRTQPGEPCRWSQTFAHVRKPEDWSQFAWFLATELLHPLAGLGVRELHSPNAVSEERSREESIDLAVLSLRDDLVSWQVVEGCSRIPSVEENPVLAKRAEKYYTGGAAARVKPMTKAYPPDFAPLSTLALDCLANGPDAQAGILWRSAAERALLFAVPGWSEGGCRKQCYVPLEDLVGDANQVVMGALRLLQDPQKSLTRKLERVAALLDCSPTLPAVNEAVSGHLLRSFSDDPSVLSERYCCRLCDFNCQNLTDLKEHIVSSHCVRSLDVERAFVEYRKKILAMVAQRSCGPLAHAIAFYVSFACHVKCTCLTLCRA